MESGDEAQPGPSSSGASSRSRRSTRLKECNESPAVSSGHNSACTPRWTHEEKRAFLCGLEMFGCYEVEAISSLVGQTKSLEQLETKIRTLKSSMTHVSGADQVKELCRLERWYNHLQQVQTGPCAPDVIPRILRFIPTLENFPDPSEVGIDFKEAYNALADLIEGKRVDVSPTTSALFASTVKEAYNILAHQGGVSAEVQQGALKKWIEESAMETDHPSEGLRRPAPKCFLSSPELNPFNVPPSFLTANAVYDMTNLPFARIMMNDWKPQELDEYPSEENSNDGSDVLE